MGPAGLVGPAGPAPAGTGAVVVNSGVSSSVVVTGDGALNPATGVLTITKTNGVAFAAVATSGSASDLGVGTLPHARLPVLLSGDVPNNAANTTGNAGTATALASAPALCPAGSYTLGIAVTGSAQNCTALPTFPASAIIGASDAQTLTNKSIDAGEITTGTISSARGGAGIVAGALKGNGAGLVSQASCADLSNAAPSCSTDTTNAANIATGTLPHGRLPLLLTGDIPNNAASTTGNAATATALAGIPTLCPPGQAPTGILASGNATGCASSSGSSSPSITISTSGPVADPGGASNFLFNNSTGALTFSLTDGVAGYQRCYRNSTGIAGAITIAVTTANSIDLNGVNGTVTTGTLVSSGAVGDAACVISDQAHHWYANVSSGTWTNN